MRVGTLRAPALFLRQAEAVHVRVVIDYEDAAVRNSEAAEVNPGRDGGAAVVQLLAGLGVQRFENGGASVEQTLLFAAVLYGVLAGR